MEIIKNITNTNRTVSNNRDIKYLVMHYVGAVSTARNNASYFKNTYRGASAHYFVDDNEVVQVVEDKDIAWHCGNDVYYCGARNSNSLSIEMCCYRMSNGNLNITADTEARAVELAKELIKKYNIPIENVVRHYDVTRKNCPAPMVSDVERWNNFKKKLQEQNATEDTTNNENNEYEKRVKNWQDTMNLDYNSNLAIDGSFGPACREQALEHYLYYKIPTIKNEHVRLVQRNLNRLGYAVDVDGSFGPIMESTIKKFQEENQIEVDGYVGAETTALLLK
mgnify:CR=1 FL=1